MKDNQIEKEFIETAIHFLHNGALLSLISEANDNSLLVQNYNKLSKLESELAQLKAEAENNEKSLFDSYSDFVFKAFPDASSNDHLKKLIIEAEEAMQDNRDIMEYADCLGAIYGAATKAGFSYDELIRAGFEKLEINKTRKWAKLDDGTYQHIEAEADKEVSDEDIEKWAWKDVKTKGNYYEGLIDGAKSHKYGKIPSSGKVQIKEQGKEKLSNEDRIRETMNRNHEDDADF